MTAPFAVGTTNLEPEGRTKLKRIKFGKDRNRLVVRIAPPIKTAAAKGRFCEFFKTHYGYTWKDEGGKDRWLTFSCIEDKDWKTKAVKQNCYECDEIATQKAALKAKVDELTAQGKTKTEIQLQTKPIEDWLGSVESGTTGGHNLDKAWVFLAKEEDNVWGVLYLKHTAKEVLFDRIKKLKEKKIDAMDPNSGVQFILERNIKSKFDVSFTCEVVTEEVDYEGGKLERTKKCPLTDDDYAQLDKLPELYTLGARVLAPTQVQMLVESGGDPEIVKALSESPENASTERSPRPVVGTAAVGPTGTTNSKGLGAGVVGTSAPTSGVVNLATTGVAPPANTATGPISVQSFIDMIK